MKVAAQMMQGMNDPSSGRSTAFQGVQIEAILAHMKGAQDSISTYYSKLTES